jgi:hypothetical protein
MASPAAPATIAILVLMPLLAWRIYARIRRVVGRQKLSRRRAGLTLAVFPVLITLLILVSQAHVERLAWLAVGLAAGSLLAVYGLRLTRFESLPEGVFYTPSAHLGIALSLLLVGRVLFRLFQLYGSDASTLPAATNAMLGPFTLLIVGLLAGYYMGYALGLVRWRPTA